MVMTMYILTVFRVRRIKCDEAKPSCARYVHLQACTWVFSRPDSTRCISTGRKCDGYEPILRDFQIQVWVHNRDPGLQNQITVFAGYGDNVRYLEFYHRHARPALSSNFDDDFWSRIVLQLAHSEPAVRHALIALGSLCETETGTMKYARAKFAADENYRFVLTQYNKSVRSLVQRMNETTYSDEVGLVTCLLFICMEFLRGNYHAAFTHMKNGLRIISDRRETRPDSLTTSKTEGEYHNVFKTTLPRPRPDPMPLDFLGRDYIGAPTATILREIPRPSSSSTSMVETRLVPIFIRGIAPALLYGVNAQESLDIPLPAPSLLQQETFANFSKAQEACHELRNASILYLRSMGQKLIQGELPTPEDWQRKNCLLECHSAWIGKLEILEKQVQQSMEQKIAANALRASHYTTFIYVSCSMEVNEMWFDAYIDEFKTILYHANIVVDYSAHRTSYGPHFTFEISIIPQLYFVATRCRCPTTRREAVAILARNPPREGLWDSQQHVLVSNRAIEIEEDEIDSVTGWPVERTRLTSCVISADMDRNGGFWVTFLPARWVGELGPDGKQKLQQEFFHL